MEDGKLLKEMPSLSFVEHALRQFDPEVSILVYYTCYLSLPRIAEWNVMELSV